MLSVSSVPGRASRCVIPETLWALRRIENDKEIKKFIESVGFVGIREFTKFTELTYLTYFSLIF